MQIDHHKVSIDDNDGRSLETRLGLMAKKSRDILRSTNRALSCPRVGLSPSMSSHRVHSDIILWARHADSGQWSKEIVMSATRSASISPRCLPDQSNFPPAICHGQTSVALLAFHPSTCGESSGPCTEMAGSKTGPAGCLHADLCTSGESPTAQTRWGSRFSRVEIGGSRFLGHQR